MIQREPTLQQSLNFPFQAKVTNFPLRTPTQETKWWNVQSYELPYVCSPHAACLRATCLPVGVRGCAGTASLLLAAAYIVDHAWPYQHSSRHNKTVRLSLVCITTNSMVPSCATATTCSAVPSPAQRQRQQQPAAAFGNLRMNQKLRCMMSYTRQTVKQKKLKERLSHRPAAHDAPCCKMSQPQHLPWLLENKHEPSADRDTCSSHQQRRTAGMLTGHSGELLDRGAEMARARSSTAAMVGHRALVSLLLTPPWRGRCGDQLPNKGL